MSGTVLTTNSADPAANNDSTLSSLISTRMSALSIWFEMLSGKDGELIYDLSSGLKKSFHIKHKKNSLGEESYRRFPLRFIDIHIKLRFLAGEIDMMEEKFESKPVPPSGHCPEHPHHHQFIGHGFVQSGRYLFCGDAERSDSECRRYTGCSGHFGI